MLSNLEVRKSLLYVPIFHFCLFSCFLKFSLNTTSNSYNQRGYVTDDSFQKFSLNFSNLL